MDVSSPNQNIITASVVGFNELHITIMALSLSPPFVSISLLALVCATCSRCIGLYH
jgi:hypothetical protein